MCWSPRALSILARSFVHIRPLSRRWQFLRSRLVQAFASLAGYFFRYWRWHSSQLVYSTSPASSTASTFLACAALSAVAAASDIAFEYFPQLAPAAAGALAV